MTTEASVILAIVQDLPQKTKQTLAYLLARDLAESGLGDQSPASRLGLIVDLIVEREGELPSVRDYEDSRRSADIRWPSASQIVRTYGSWVTAIRTATAVGQAGRTPRKLVTYPSHAYTRDEAIYSLLRCQQDLGSWPSTLREYSAWASLSRSAQLHWGNTRDRVVTGSVLRKKLGPLERAIAIASARTFSSV